MGMRGRTRGFGVRIAVLLVVSLIAVGLVRGSLLLQRSGGACRVGHLAGGLDETAPISACAFAPNAV